MTPRTVRCNPRSGHLLVGLHRFAKASVRSSVVFEALPPDSLSRPVDAFAALDAVEAPSPVTYSRTGTAFGMAPPSVTNPMPLAPPTRRPSPISRLVPAAAGASRPSHVVPAHAPHRPMALPPGPMLSALAAMVAPPAPPVVAVAPPPPAPELRVTDAGILSPAHLASLLGVLAAGIAIGHCFF